MGQCPRFAVNSFQQEVKRDFAIHTKQNNYSAETASMQESIVELSSPDLVTDPANSAGIENMVENAFPAEIVLTNPEEVSPQSLDETEKMISTSTHSNMSTGLGISAEFVHPRGPKGTGTPQKFTFQGYTFSTSQADSRDAEEVDATEETVVFEKTVETRQEIESETVPVGEIQNETMEDAKQPSDTDSFAEVFAKHTNAAYAQWFAFLETLPATPSSCGVPPPEIITTVQVKGKVQAEIPFDEESLPFDIRSNLSELDLKTIPEEGEDDDDLNSANSKQARLTTCDQQSTIASTLADAEKDATGTPFSLLDAEDDDDDILTLEHAPSDELENRSGDMKTVGQAPTGLIMCNGLQQYDCGTTLAYRYCE